MYFIIIPLYPAHRLVDFVARKDSVTVMTEVLSDISPPPGISPYPSLFL